MAEMDGRGVETREFLLPITLTVGEREVEIPLAVVVTFDQLTEIVSRHLQSGTDVYAELLELYAEQAGGRKKGRSKPAPPQAPAPAGRSRSRKKAAEGDGASG